MTKKMISATKLKAIMKALPGKLFLECNLTGNLDLYLKEEGNVYIGKIDFESGGLSLIRCPICAVDLEATDTKGKRRCPSCKNLFQG